MTMLLSSLTKKTALWAPSATAVVIELGYFHQPLSTHNTGCLTGMVLDPYGFRRT